MNFYKFIIGIFAICIGCSSQPPAETINLALHLNGKDNSVAIGMDIIREAWTLEAWIKGDDNQWKEVEGILGGGEYSELSYVDDLPLTIYNGKLHSTKADLWSDDILDDHWHHVAVSGDGKNTKLYLDGELVDSSNRAYAILPGVIGSRNGGNTVFGGLIDEVRIWETELTQQTLQQWMNQPLRSSHPQFNKLKGYYTFDDGLDESSINQVGKGWLSNHIRNYINREQEKTSLAYTVVNDNPYFQQPSYRQELFNAVVIESEWDVDKGKADDPLLQLRIAVTGNMKSLHLTELVLDLTETTDISDLSQIHIYYTGNKPNSNTKTELFGEGITPDKKIRLKKEALKLTPGINYFLITTDVSPEARPGNRIKVKIPSFSLNGKKYQPETYPMLDKQVTENSRQNPNILRVLQWNIWVGGIKLGEDGIRHIIDLIKACDPDIITMQEGYGSQHRIAQTLGYHLQTPSPSDNLALFSRYPIEQLPSSKIFQSNPAKIALPNGRTVLVNDCWLRYAVKPEYTGIYPETGHNTDLWIADDSIRPMADIKHILNQDVYPAINDVNMPVIIGGDFNSCSHLDWTKAAAPLHYGYGPVDFPTSRYMLEEGFKDSFREINPDEVKRPEGTFAVIFGQLHNSRIDFLYYKGANIKPITSKIIRTTPCIDFVWPGDHEAVVTNFEIEDL